MTRPVKRDEWPVERGELMDLFDSFMARPNPNDNALFTKRIDEYAADIIKRSKNPDLVKIWMRQYGIVWYMPGQDAMKIRMAIRQQILTERLADDIFRIVIRPIENDNCQNVRSWYVDAPASSNLRDAIEAYDKLHGTKLVYIHCVYPGLCRKGDGSEYTEPATPYLIRSWMLILTRGNDPFTQYRPDWDRSDPYIPAPGWEADE